MTFHNNLNERIFKNNFFELFFYRPNIIKKVSPSIDE